MKLSGAEIVIRQLEAHGVTTVFGYPGGAVLTLYDELYKASDRIHHVLTAHEQGAAHAADGYARVTGKTGVVIATSGPGATNLVTGIANAYLDSVPMVAITGNVAVPMLGRDSFQEVNIAGITNSIVKHNYVVRDIEELEETLREAFYIASSGRCGPVLVDIPKNIQSEKCEYAGKSPIPATNTPCVFDIAEIADIIARSERPLIYAGGGVIASGAQDKLLELSEKLAAPVGLSLMGLGALSSDYPLNLGLKGMHGGYASNMAAAECDLLIAAGTRFSDRATGDVGEYEKSKTIIHIDIDNAEISKNVSSNIEICGDVKDVLTQLIPKVQAKSHEKWTTRITELVKEQKKQEQGYAVPEAFSPKNIIEAVCNNFDEDTVVATDVGQHQMWTAQYYKLRKPRTLLTSGGLGAMGYGLGAAIGGCFARNKGRTVLITGDGSFGMNLNELATAVTNKLPIVIIILNNQTLGLPYQWQSMFYEQRYSQSIMNRKTDFAALAQAFGARGHRIENLKSLKEVLENLSDGIPTVIDCPIGGDELVLPMIPPGGSIKDMVVGG
ncbi:MAG: biosynthetic-type acetolactate synthase large subunit [Oscillospiraceae bacterium]|nr:biosynthetic-type acetolactate synthase large subunit [Oscillospiraceae bacterium]